MRLRHLAYRAWQAAWGPPQPAAGLCVYAANARKPHFAHHGAIVTIWRKNAGLSLGPFVFLNAWQGNVPVEEQDERSPRYVEYLPGIVLDDRLLVHEYGHTVQSLILGPLYLPVIGLPSVIWLNAPRLAQRRHDLGISYYALYPERWANHLGKLVLKRPSMGQALID